MPDSHDQVLLEPLGTMKIKKTLIYSTLSARFCTKASKFGHFAFTLFITFPPRARSAFLWLQKKAWEVSAEYCAGNHGRNSWLEWYRLLSSKWKFNYLRYFHMKRNEELEHCFKHFTYDTGSLVAVLRKHKNLLSWIGSLNSIARIWVGVEIWLDSRGYQEKQGTFNRVCSMNFMNCSQRHGSRGLERFQLTV